MNIIKKIRKGAAMSLATLFAWMVAGVAFAQTTTSAMPVAAPGVPNTGTGGMAATNFLVLAAAVLVAVVCVAYLAYSPKEQQ